MNPDDLDERLEQLYQSASVASSEGLRDEAVDRCHEAMNLIEMYGDDTERHNYSDFVVLIGDIHWAAGDYEEAFLAYYRVAMNDPERSDARIAVGVSLFHLCRFEAARAQLELCSAEHPEDGETWYYLGLLALRRERTELARIFFQRAVEGDENRYFIPPELSDDEVKEVVGNFVAELPDPLRESLAEVPIIIDSLPSEETLFSADPPVDPTVLGLFEGTPLPERSAMEPVTGPTRILLFIDNIRTTARNEEELKEEIEVTLKHEIGHYFGLDEDELAARGLD